MPVQDHQFLEIARIISESSKCVSLKVGAVLVREGRIISVGFNGTPSGYTNCCDVHRSRGTEHTEWSNRVEVHAEQNCVLFAARSGISTEGATMYTTIEPCHQCVKLLVVAGIKKVVYSEAYYREEIDNKIKEEFAELCGMHLEHFTSASTGA